MPRGDGTGPRPGGGRMGGYAMGPGGNCICPNCGHTVPHQQGVPCTQVQCPECGTSMTRQR